MDGRCQDDYYMYKEAYNGIYFIICIILMFLFEKIRILIIFATRYISATRDAIRHYHGVCYKNVGQKDN